MSFKIINDNRKAYYEYEILETFEAGIVLSGKEIKAIRAGKVNLTGSYAKVIVSSEPRIVKKSQLTDHNSQISTPELFLLGAHISVIDGDPTRTRKLLLHRKEINRLIGKIQEKNLTLIPTKLYLKNGKAKVELGLGRGKKLRDKREIIKKRDMDREEKTNKY